MANKAKIKGTAAETGIVNYLNANGFPWVERRALAGVLDKGDIAGLRNTVIEVKNCAKLSIPQWIREANQEGVNAGTKYGGVVWYKQRGTTNPADWVVAMDGETYIEYLKLIEGVEDE